MTSLDPSATLIRALAPEPFDAFEQLAALLPGSAPARPLELARRRMAMMLDGANDALGAITELDVGDVDAIASWPTSLRYDVVDRAVLELAEQFVVDVAATSDDQRRRCLGDLGDRAFDVVQSVYVLDHGLRVRAALRQLFGVSDVLMPASSHTAEQAVGPEKRSGQDLWEALEHWMRAVARLDSLDPLTTELVRLRGARAHDCRLCRSLRNVHAVRSGADESIFDQIDDYENSGLSERHKVILRLTDAMLWQPTAYPVGLVDQVHQNLTSVESIEVVLDVARNASNKIAVAFGADEAHVVDGVEFYELDERGDVVHGVGLES